LMAPPVGRRILEICRAGAAGRNADIEAIADLRQGLRGPDGLGLVAELDVAHLQEIAAGELVLADLGPVDAGAIGRIHVLDEEVFPVEGEHRVVAGDAAVVDVDVVFWEAAQGHLGLEEFKHAPLEFGGLHHEPSHGVT